MYAKVAEESEEKYNKFGIDVSDGNIKDVVEAGILDCWETKSWALKLCSDSVLTILKVDQIIMSKPSGGPNFESQAARRPDGY
jgi:T-complex protein 1 subunit theta